jgi:hypothetical protein
MEEVKHLYAKGQYKHCAMRCKQLLEGIKEPVGLVLTYQTTPSI